MLTSVDGSSQDLFSLTPRYFLDLIFPFFPYSYFEDPTSTSLPVIYEIQLLELCKSLKFLCPKLKLQRPGPIVALLTLLATLPFSSPSHNASTPSSYTLIPLRLPIALLRNPDPTVRSPRVFILRCAFEFFYVHSFDWKTWIQVPSFLSQPLSFFSTSKFTFSSLLQSIRNELIQAEFISIPNLVLHSTLQNQCTPSELSILEERIKALGGTLESELSSGTTHILYPPCNRRKLLHPSEEKWIRSVEFRNDHCLLHTLNTPDSQDVWFSLTPFVSIKNPFFYPPPEPSSVFKINVSWIFDSYNYHEFMNELDYLVNDRGEALISPLEQKWDPYFLVQPCGLEPSIFVKSQPLVEEAKEFNETPTVIPSSSSEIELQFVDQATLYNKDAFPQILNLCQANSMGAFSFSLSDPQVTEILNNSHASTLSDEELPFFNHIKTQPFPLSEQTYVKLRNLCIHAYSKNPQCVLQFDLFKLIDPTIHCSIYCELLTFWEHQHWIHSFLSMPSSTPAPSLSVPRPLTIPSSSITCHSCHLPLSSPPYYQSIHQPFLYLCADCFASGRLKGSSLMYSRINSTPISKSLWTKAEKVQLLKSIQTHGIDQWELVAKELNKSMVSCVLEFVTLSPSLNEKDTISEGLVPFEAMPNPVLYLIHSLMMYAPALSAYLAQQALTQLPKLEIQQLYPTSIPYALRLAQLEHQTMQPLIEQLFQSILQRIEIKWQWLLKLDQAITQLITTKSSSTSSQTKSNANQGSKKKINKI